MATTETATSSSQPVESFVESAIVLGTSLVRLGSSLIAIPLSLLPLRARQDAAKLTHQMLTSVDKVNVSLLKTASRVGSAWLGELDKAIAATAKPVEPEAKALVIETPAEPK